MTTTESPHLYKVVEDMMKADIAIITIREDEFTAVRSRFQTKRQRIDGGRTYLIGEVKTNDKQTYTIAIARCSEQGTDASQKLTHYIIHHLDPQLILVVGIAGGIPHEEFTLGDVVISTRIVNPNIDAWHPDGTTDYMTRGGPPHPLIEDIVSLLPSDPQLAGWADSIQLERPSLDLEHLSIEGDDEWCKKVRRSLEQHFGEEDRGRSPTAVIGPIISSNHLMKDPTRLKDILKTHRAALAVEMEASGVYEAAYGTSPYPVMAIRGISDIVGLQRDRRWTAYACETAAAFIYAFIMSTPIKPREALLTSESRIGSANVQGLPENKLFGLAQKISMPLSLATLTVLVIVVIYKAVLSLPIFSQSGQNFTVAVINTIVLDLFILAFVGLVLGIGSFILGQVLKYRVDVKKYISDHRNGSEAGEKLESVYVHIDEQADTFVLDITVRNVGMQVAILTHVTLDILDFVEFYRCSEDIKSTRTVLDISRNYDIELAPHEKGKRQQVRISHQIKPNEADRFRLSIGQNSGNMAPAYVWYLLDVSLEYNKQTQSITSEPFLLSIPPVDLSRDNVWEVGEHTCVEKNKAALRRVSVLKGIRSDSIETTIQRILKA